MNSVNDKTAGNKMFMRCGDSVLVLKYFLNLVWQRWTVRSRSGLTFRYASFLSPRIPRHTLTQTSAASHFYGKGNGRINYVSDLIQKSDALMKGEATIMSIIETTRK